MSFWKELIGRIQLLTSRQPKEPFEWWMEEDDTQEKFIYRPLLYVLQHKVLPNVLQLNEYGWEYFLELGQSTTGLIELAHLAAKTCESSGLWVEGATDMQSFPIYVQNLMSQARVSLIKDDNWDIRVISMPKPITLCEAYWIALCIPRQRTEDSGRYFTLEFSVGKGNVSLCEWTEAGEHINYWIGPLLTIKRFAAGIKLLLRD